MDVIRRCFVVFALLSVVNPVGAQDDAVEAELELNRVREKIEKLEKKVRAAGKRRGSAQSALRQAELAENAARQKLTKITGELKDAQKRLVELNQRVAQSRAALDAHGDELAQQLRLAYMTAREDWLRTMLNKSNPTELSRQLVYYKYIAQQRTGLMDQVRDELEALRVATAAVAEERQRLARLKSTEQTRLDELSNARAKRADVLARIESDITTGSNRLAALQDEAKGLEALVADLTRLLSQLSSGDAVPFRKRKGAMAWPVDGRIVGSFGDSRAGGTLRWDGVMLSAGAGADVRAVHNGRVVFADWLPGMGLLMVIDHGDGFMSLYGHNQDLLRDVGEWVSPDTVIAHVGDSGGRPEPGLYFEIRKDGRPVDPTRWVDR